MARPTQWASVAVTSLLFLSMCAMFLAPHPSLAEPAPTSIWPMPQKLIVGKEVYGVDPAMRLSLVHPSSKCAYVSTYSTILSWALGAGLRVVNEIENEPHAQFTTEPIYSWKELEDSNRFPVFSGVDSVPSKKAKFIIRNMLVNVSSPDSCGAPSIHVDETYSIEISTRIPEKSVVTITAATYAGAIRAAATLAQMLYTDDGSIYLADMNVIDSPRFPHRGLLIDTSRHYLTTQTIKGMIFTMAMNKFNVLHWHIVDDPSFPYKSVAFPNVFLMGAFTPVETHGYSLDAIREIVDLATKLGVRVVPEFDTPGHSESWRGIDPNFLSKCYKDGKPDGRVQNIDPTVENNYAILGKFFNEVSSVFPDRYMHIGGDEVNPVCWNSNPNIQEFMSNHSLKTANDLQVYYTERLQSVLSPAYPDLIAWEEVFDRGNGLQGEESVYHVWFSGTSKVEEILNANRSVLYSTCWYLDIIARKSDWRGYYACEPLNFLSGADDPRFLGGEAALWGEFIDGGNLPTFSWPRASAVGERLWSAKSVNDVDAAAPRINDFRCFMQAGGIPASANTGPGTHCYREYDPISYTNLQLALDSLSSPTIYG